MGQAWKAKIFLRSKYKYLGIIDQCVQKLTTTASASQIFTTLD